MAVAATRKLVWALAGVQRDFVADFRADAMGQDVAQHDFALGQTLPDLGRIALLMSSGRLPSIGEIADEDHADLRLRSLARADDAGDLCGQNRRWRRRRWPRMSLPSDSGILADCPC